MTTPTTRIGLLKPTTADDFSTLDLANNWQIIDDYAGRFVVATNLPSAWGVAQAGMTVYQVSTGLEWTWSGTVFHRTAPVGWLASATRTTDLSTTSTTMVNDLVSVAGVAVPRGGRKVQVHVAWSEAENTVGRTLLAIYRDNTALYTWAVGNEQTNQAPQGLGGSMIQFDQPGEGAFTYSFKFCVDPAVGGASTVRASSIAPIQIDVSEI